MHYNIQMLYLSKLFSMQNIKNKNENNPIKLRIWNKLTFLRPRKFEKLKQMNLKQLDILGVCETRWSTNRDFWNDDIYIKINV